ncbi:3-hydroxyacyl-ACP dehydratase FabZ family protein [Nocardia sp. 004]|uniref:3-hydroxyacyl-ACP dehydratase FabZ family protein n=1 Tax=Nocardia sp. 004 TaxID=3385978 RepID=UPI0039A18E8F
MPDVSTSISAAHTEDPADNHAAHHTDSMLGFSQIKSLLRHRHPMLYLDRVTTHVPGESLTGLLAVSGNMDAIAGHFPERAVFPGTHLAQTFSQAGIVLYLLSSRPLRDDEMTLIGSLNSRFTAPVVPGDVVQFDLRVRRLLDDMMLFGARAHVEQRTVALFRGTLSRVSLDRMGEQLW